jgi:hypothetical protein
MQTLDKDYVRTTPGVRWEDFYAERVLEHFAGMSKETQHS